MNELVTVIISNLFEEHLPETLVNLRNTADGPIEIIVKNDEDCKGMRHYLNVAADEAKGEYLFKIDGHCIMSPHWDTLMKKACGDKDMVVARIKPISERTWSIIEERGFGFVTINQDMSIIACGDFVMDDPDIAETMASIGCAWMIHKKRFNELEQNWCALGRYGNLGAEWELKIWLSGGKLLVPRGVICGHLFRRAGVAMGGANAHAKAGHMLGQRFAAMKGPLQIHSLKWLAERFNKIREPALKE